MWVGCVITVFAFCAKGGGTDTAGTISDDNGGSTANSGIAQSGRSVTTGGSSQSFLAVAADSSGNAYAAGRQGNSSTYTYGTGVSAAGSFGGNNALLVKYNSLGNALWAKSVTGGGGNSLFNSVAVDSSSGNIYAVGSQNAGGAFTYGTGVTATGPYSLGTNAVVVKYDTNGNALWARAPTASGISTVFYGVAVDAAGNVYVVGTQNQLGTVTYGAGITAAGSYNFGVNAVIVKYNHAGDAQWARSVTTGGSLSSFTSVAVDSASNVYAAGLQSGSGAFTYAAGITATNPCACDGGVLVKYDSAGDAQWAKTATAAAANSKFTGIVLDGSGYIITVGTIAGTSAHSFATGISATGVHTGNNALVVKFNNAGTAQWARTVSAGASFSEFNAVSADSSGNIFASGKQDGNSAYTYSTGVSVAGSFGAENIILAKYDSSGNASWAKSTTTGATSSTYNGVAVGGSNVFAVGTQFGTTPLSYGAGVSVAGFSSSVNNLVIVRYSK